MIHELEKVFVGLAANRKAPPPHFTEHEQCSVPVTPDNGASDHGNVQGWPPHTFKGNCMAKKHAASSTPDVARR